MPELHVDEVSSDLGTVRVTLHSDAAGLEHLVLRIDSEVTQASYVREGPPGATGVPYTADFAVRKPCSGYGAPFDGTQHQLNVAANGVESVPIGWGYHGTCHHIEEDYLTPFVGMVVFFGVIALMLISVVRGLLRERRPTGELTRSAERLGPSAIAHLRRFALRGVALFALWAAWPEEGLHDVGSHPVRGLLLVAIVVLAASSRAC